ncbi:hypothetical protein ART_0450 [Arthrobacter sp. PAMC 25486]|uniref:transposase n=1 Tax=Arthrobacter sp. PAMC 25486 TaxID=1494608 RepID=UPI000535E66D|nr:transposase [Arthrobacter sp. PAMC 25486]AIY00049.1 hypothetical protein ART_0450 [Arthrobacter sp. PAMC 25486]
MGSNRCGGSSTWSAAPARTIIDTVFGPASIGETTYTPRLLRGMIILADRSFASVGLLHQIRDVGAEFLVRVIGARINLQQGSMLRSRTGQLTPSH